MTRIYTISDTVPFGGSSGGMTTTDITQWASHITSFTKALRICDFTLSIGTSCSCRRLPRQPATQLFDILMGHSPSINHYIVEKNPLPGYYQNIPWRVHKQRSLYITNPKSAQWRGKSLKFTTFLHCLIHPICAMSWSQSEILIWHSRYLQDIKGSCKIPPKLGGPNIKHTKKWKWNKTKHTHTTWMTPCFPPNSSRFFSDFKHKKSQHVPGSCNSCSLRWRSFNFARSECLKASGPDSRKSRWWTLGHSTWRLLENPLVTFHRKYNDSTSNARCFIASHVI